MSEEVAESVGLVRPVVPVQDAGCYCTPCVETRNGNLTKVEMGPKEQGIVYFPGDGEPLYLQDSMKVSELKELLTDAQFMLLYARLIYWSDAIDSFMDEKEDRT